MTSGISSIYRELLSKSKDLAVMGTAEGIIHWDMETMMPPGAVEQRSEQLALLSRLHHKLSTDPEIGKLIKKIKSNPEFPNLTEMESRNTFLIDKNFREQTSLPEKLVSEIAKQEAITVNTWKKAKAVKKFSLLKADLQKLLTLNKQSAEILMKTKETKTAYDAAIDNFEPKMTTEQITPIFEELQSGLKQLIRKIRDSSVKTDMSTLRQSVPIENQRQIAQLLTRTMGFDTESASAHGRIDQTEHPFTSGYLDDVRITTHYYQNNFVSSIFSVLHETGHAIYSQNLNPKWKYQPIGSSCSFGIHESQSRFYENIIGRSNEFWMSFMPKLKSMSPNLEKIKTEEFIRAINNVELSKIRIEADEVTYNMHIIVRFEIEKDLFADKISVDELPEVWNQKYDDYLGVEVENDSEGVMQDTHWASGLYGYFPSYALGNIYSGQIVEAITNDLPEWRKQLEQGKLGLVNEWLKSKIHSQGDLYDPQELIKTATGRSLDAKAFLRYLTEKYSSFYGF